MRNSSAQELCRFGHAKSARSAYRGQTMMMRIGVGEEESIQLPLQ